MARRGARRPRRLPALRRRRGGAAGVPRRRGFPPPPQDRAPATVRIRNFGRLFCDPSAPSRESEMRRFALRGMLTVVSLLIAGTAQADEVSEHVRAAV